jgi:tRNA pseudouridine13 synthase
MNEFFTKTEPLSGRIKQRYSDFIVEEIKPNGKKCEVKRFDREFSKREINEFRVPEKPINAGKETDSVIVEMEKINTETNQALAIISRGLSMGKTRLGYAGLKDKRGITCQRISIYEPDINKLERFNVKGMELRNPEWGSRIELGDLKGNAFKIVIRDIEKSETEIREILTKFFEAAQKGVPNYFGMQRFGGKRMITHRVGKSLLTRNYEEAVMLYLTETYEEEKPFEKEARLSLAKTRDFKTAMRNFPMELRTEKAMLNELCKADNASRENLENAGLVVKSETNKFKNALNSLPKKMRYLFTHAYQSFLFNEMLSKRIEMLGDKALEPVEGDILEDGEPTIILPGFEVEHAQGIMGEIEKQVLVEEGITLQSFRNNEQSELSSKGARKKITLKIINPKIISIGADDFNEGKRKAEISFELGKGEYATTVLRELLKEEIF